MPRLKRKRHEFIPEYFPLTKIKEKIRCQQIVSTGPDSDVQKEFGLVKIVLMAEEKSVWIQTHTLSDKGVFKSAISAAMSGVDVRVMIHSRTIQSFTVQQNTIPSQPTQDGRENLCVSKRVPSCQNTMVVGK